MAVLVAVLVYWLEGVIGRIVIFENHRAVWWPINGIVLGTLLATPRRHWAWILAGFAVGLGASEHDRTTLFLLVDPICNTLEVLLPALVLPRFRSMDRWLARPGVTRHFLLVAMVAAPGAEALAAGFYNDAVPKATFWDSALNFGSADMLGFALFTPLLLALLSRETWELLRPAALPKTAGLISLLGGVSWLVFHQRVFEAGFVVYPLLLAVGTELGLSGAILAIDLLAVIATQATVAGTGPFGNATVTPMVRLAELQIYLAMSVTMALPVAVARVKRLTTEAKLKRAWEAMEALATVDGLTGVANRRRFDALLDREWRRAARSRLPVSLLLIDADRFKAYNDNYGHLAGDACLRAIAKSISQATGRPGDSVARYGGEEFAVLLAGTDGVGAALVAERVRCAVHDLAIPHGFSEAKRVTVSIGLASLVPEEGSDPLTLIEVSDRALYNAKHRGRNVVSTPLDIVASTC
jgi:diguanylate cyclase (GGDEF)-like protein